MKKSSLAVLALVAALLPAQAQQITSIAVIDLQRIFLAYQKDSQAVRDFEAKKVQIQAEIDRMTAEIKTLQQQRAEADKAGDAAAVLRLDAEIARRIDYVREFRRVKQAELDAEKRRLMESDAFVKEMYRSIQSIAEGDGYSLVINLRSSDYLVESVVWYSPMIDITDMIIQSLIGKVE